MIALLSVESDINEWTKDDGQWQSFQDFCGFLEKHILINLMLACSCIAVFVWKVLCIWKDNDFRLYRPLLILLGFEVIHLYDNMFKTIIVGFITYGILFIALFSITGIFVGYKILYYFAKNKFDTISSKGFSTDDIDIKNVSKNLEDYAKSIVAHLLNTDTSKHSFALGVTGEWGGGKTTFLELLDSKMKGRAEKVWFNPWMCRTPEQVADDFFCVIT